MVLCSRTAAFQKSDKAQKKQKTQWFGLGFFHKGYNLIFKVFMYLFYM